VSNKYVVTGMAFSRDKWVDKFRSRLEGALKEFTKLKIAESLGQKDYWSHEVKALVKVVDKLFAQEVQTKGSWDRYKAAAEAYLDSHGEETKLTEAFNEYLVYAEIPEKERKKAAVWWRKNRPDAEDLSFEMLERYMRKENFDGLVKELQAY